MMLRKDCMMFPGLLLALTLLCHQPAKGFTLSASSCSALMCRPGQECRQQIGSAPHCACVLKCPEHWKPVCGSDGESYDNHCSLHRAACLSGAPVSPLHPGFCRKEIKSNDLDEWRQHQTTSSPPPHTPSACLQKDRDDLRRLVLDWFLNSNVSEPIWQRLFPSVDSNGDGFLDSDEVFSNINSNKMFKKPLTYSNLNTRMRGVEKRQLCVDALVEEGDLNSDWRLNVQEFSRLFDSAYLPSDKSCNLNGLDFKDGRTTSLECNSCVCACGKWICTSEKCPQHSQNSHQQHISYTKNLVASHGPDYNKEDDYDDEEDDDYSEEEDYDLPEDDPDVKDIRWF